MIILCHSKIWPVMLLLALVSCNSKSTGRIRLKERPSALEKDGYSPDEQTLFEKIEELKKKGLVSSIANGAQDILKKRNVPLTSQSIVLLSAILDRIGTFSANDQKEIFPTYNLTISAESKTELLAIAAAMHAAVMQPSPTAVSLSKMLRSTLDSLASTNSSKAVIPYSTIFSKVADSALAIEALGKTMENFNSSRVPASLSSDAESALTRGAYIPAADLTNALESLASQSISLTAIEVTDATLSWRNLSLAASYVVSISEAPSAITVCEKKVSVPILALGANGCDYTFSAEKQYSAVISAYETNGIRVNRFDQEPLVFSVKSANLEAPGLSIAAGLDNIINMVENAGPGVSVSIAGEAGASYLITCITNCTVTAGASGTLNGGSGTATIKALGSGVVAISATQIGTSGKSSLTGTATTTADIDGPVFTSLALSNGANDNTLNNTEINTNLPVATLSASGLTNAYYAMVSTSTTCDAAVNYNKATLPTAGDVGFVDGNSYKLCVKLTDNALNATYGSSSGNILVDSSTPSISALTIGAGPDNIINMVENTGPGVSASITGEAGASYSLTCSANCTVTAGASGTLNASGSTTASIRASATGAVSVFATLTDTAGNTSLATNASSTADIDAPVFLSLALSNGAADNIVNSAEVAANLPVATVSASGHTTADYAIVATSATCDAAVNYNKATTPTAGDVGFVDGNHYKLCVKLTDNATNETYGASSGNFVVSVSAPMISYVGANGTTGVVGQNMSVTPTTLDANGSSITNCTSSPSLPSGLTIQSTTCVISGVPTTATSAKLYSITATNSSSSSSASVSLTTLYFPPAYAVSAESGADSRIALSWLPPAETSQPVTAYRVYRSVSSAFTPGVGNLITTTTAATTSHLDTGLTNGTSYYYKVIAVYTWNLASPSVEASACPENPASTTQDLLHIYVAPTGNDTTGNGSIGTPYLTIAKAHTRVTSGGTIILKDGFYSAIPTFTKALTLQSMTGDYRTSSAVISASGSLTVGGQLSSSVPVDNVVFRGIETINFLFSTSSNTTRSGLGFFNCYFHTISGNTWLSLTGTANYSNITFYGNYIRSVGNGTRTDQRTFVNYWRNAGHSNANWTVSYNTIEGTSWGGFQFFAISGVRFTHNTFLGMCDDAIQVAYNGAAPSPQVTGDFEIAYNLFGSSFQAGGHATCEGTAIRLWGAEFFSSSMNFNIHHNFFMRNDVAIKLVSWGTVPACDLSNTSISIANNSFETSNAKAIQLGCTSGTLDLRGNYWGHSSGPNYSENAGGLGSTFNLVSGSVNVSPFLTGEPAPPQAVLKGQNEVGGSGAALSSPLTSSVVLFQSDLTQNSVNRGTGTSDLGVSANYGIGAFRDKNAAGTMKFFVADRNNNRVLIFHSVPDSNSDVPDVVVGQTNFFDNGDHAGGGTTPSEFGFADPTQVTVCEDGKMFVTDPSNHRILGYNRIPVSNGVAADFVIGQSTFSGNSSGTSSTKLNAPDAVHCNANRLFVVEKENHRVVVFSPIPTANLPIVSYVIGQPDLTTGTSGCSANKLYNPYELLFLDGKIFVADGLNSRVLAFPDTGATNPTAQLVLGQANFTSCSMNSGAASPYLPTVASMYFPNALAFDGKNTLAVSDTFNHRVLFFTAPFTNGKSASSQIGQDNFTSNTLYTTPNITNRLQYPKKILFDNSYLWISDSENHRVVAFPRP